MASVILSMNASLIHLGFFLNCIDPSPLISSIVGCSHWVFGKVCSQHANFRDAVYWASASAWAVFRYLASWDRSWDFWGWGKTIQSHGICFQSCWVVLFYFLFFLTHFGVGLFSGQDEVRTSQPVASAVGLSASRSHAPTTQPSRRLKVHQLLIIEHQQSTIIAIFFNSAIYYAVCIDTPR